MPFPTKASSSTILLSSVGVVLSAYESFIHTVEEGYSGTAPAKAGYFSKIDTDGKLAMGDGTDTVGLAVHETTNLGAIDCTSNPIQSYIALGCAYAALKNGITPKRGDYLKEGADGFADIGTKDDHIGRFLGIYGEPSNDATPVKTMLVQLGGV